MEGDKAFSQHGLDCNNTVENLGIGFKSVLEISDAVGVHSDCSDADLECNNYVEQLEVGFIGVMETSDAIVGEPISSNGGLVPEICALSDVVGDGGQLVSEVRGVVDPVVPMEGMVFESEEELRDFYKFFAAREGFGISKTSVKCVEGELRYFSLACTRYGKHRPRGKSTFKPRPSVKTGCLAKITIRVQCDGKFLISRVLLDHNHLLNPYKSRHFPCHRKLDCAAKRVLDMNDVAGVRLNKSFCALVEDAGGFDVVTYGETDCRNYIAKSRLERLGLSDAQALCGYFQRMHNRNPNFYHVIDYDEDCCIRNIFWADARSWAAYESFCDVISFDTTYLTNTYKMPFAPFVGVNHHGQTILLGCGLLSNESTETYVWLFRMWLDCMGGIPPKAIVTDQCRAIQGAVAEVFPESRHRLCLWHIMMKLPVKLGSYEEYQTISECLKVVVYKSLTIGQFEERWCEMVDEHGLAENQWLSGLYEDRSRWVPMFVRGDFWAGMSTTQRSESMNAFFDGYVHSKTTLKEFVSQYDKALKFKVENEMKADFASFSSTIPLITDFEFESVYRGAYTNDMYRKIQEEIRGLICCNVQHIGVYGEVQCFLVVDVGKGKNGVSRCMQYGVEYNPSDGSVTCVCHLFEFLGILCRHCMKVLILMNVVQLNPRYVIDRWRKDVKRKHNYVTNCYDDSRCREQKARYNCLFSLFSSFAEFASLTSERFHDAKVAMESLVARVGKINISGGPLDGSEIDESCSIVRSPKMVKPKARLTSKRKEAATFKHKRSKAITTASAQSPTGIPGRLHQSQHSRQAGLVEPLLGAA